MYISLDTKAGTPLYLQVKQQMRLSIATGVLQPGDQLPTVRDLAARLRINPNTIARVYRELCAEGLLSSRQGSGTFVSDGVATMGDEQSVALARQKLAEAVAFGRNLNLSPEALDELFKQVLAESLAANPEPSSPRPAETIPAQPGISMSGEDAAPDTASHKGGHSNE